MKRDILDADDGFLPEKIHNQVRFLEQNPGYDLVHSDCYDGDEQLRRTKLARLSPPTLLFQDLYVYRKLVPPIAVLLRVELIQEGGAVRRKPGC